MTVPSTMRNGRTYILLDGGLRALWEETGVEYVTGFLDNSNVPTFLSTNSGGDLARKTAAHFLTPSTGAATEVDDQTHAIQQPVVLQIGSNTHMWYAADPGSGSTQVYYNVSTDGGATWSTPGIVVPVGSGGSWNDDQVRPLGAYHNTTTSKVVLHIAGNDGSTWKLGQWSIDDSDDFTQAINYDAHGSNPVYAASLGSGYGAVHFAEGLYHFWHGASSTPSNVFHQESEDGVTWTPSDSSPIYANNAGKHILRVSPAASGARDINQIRVTGAFYWRGQYYLFYAGNDSVNWRPMVAVGETPTALYKIGSLANLNAQSPTVVDASEVYYCTGDLTIRQGNTAQHVLDRGGPGAAIDAVFEACSGSFSFRYQAIGPSGTAASGDSDSLNLFEHMFLADPSVNEGEAISPVGDDPPRIHVLHKILTGAGANDSFVLVPYCTMGALELSEAGDGDLVQVNFMSHGFRKPVQGRF